MPASDSDSDERRSPSHVYALSRQQRELWRLTGDCATTSAATLSLPATIDASRIGDVLAALRARHEALRTTFVDAHAYREPVQQVHATDADAGLTARVDDELHLVAPALAVDPASWVILARELVDRLRDEAADRGDVVQYPDYVGWQEDVSRAVDIDVAPTGRQPALRRSAEPPRRCALLASAVVTLAAPAEPFWLALWTLLARAHTGVPSVVHAIDGRAAAGAANAIGLYRMWRRFTAPDHDGSFSDYVRACGRLAADATARVEDTPSLASFDDQLLIECIDARTAPWLAALGDCGTPAALRLRAVAGVGSTTLALFGDPREWSARTATLMLDRLRAAAEHAAADPAISVGALRWLGAADRALVASLATASSPGVSADQAPLTLFARAARAHPDAPALIDASRVTSYGELNALVDMRRTTLSQRGVRAGDRVAINLAAGVELTAAMLAVWSCGAGFIVLPPSMPAPRREAIVAVARPRFRLSAGGDVELLDEAPPWPGLACVAFTSGSTGVPRGVPQTAAAVASYLAFVRATVALGPSDVVLQLAAPDFDAAMRDSIGPLTAGAAIVHVPRDGGFDLEACVRAMRDHRVTALLSVVPSVLRALLDVAERRRGQFTLRAILCAGEPLHGTDVARARSVFGSELEIFNLYGPTECTMTSMAHRAAPGETGPIAIGRPIPHARCAVLDDELEAVAAGEVGELYLGGLGVVAGYLGAPATTAARFLPDPAGGGARLYRTGDLARVRPDGALDYVGRIDDQVKIRGTRVEPAEIAALLAKHPHVSEAVVLADRERGEIVLRAFAAISSERPRTPRGAPIAEVNDYETDFFHRRIFVDRADFSTGITLHAGDVVLDVGANVGFFTMFVAEHCPGVRVHAFEPMPDVFARLTANTRGLDDVRAHRVALGRAVGPRTFSYYAASSCQSGQYPDRAQERAILHAILGRQLQSELGRSSRRTLEDVGRLIDDRLDGRTDIACDVITISDFLRSEGIERVALLKIDVEKSELDVLLGIAPEDWGRIDQIAVEVHDLDRALSRVVELLEARGFGVVTGQEPVFEGTCVHSVHARRPGRAPGPLPLAVGQPAASAVTPALLLDHIRQRLPAESVPSTMTILSTLPRNERGKVDRQALLGQPAPCRRRAVPRDRIEDVIADLWEEILGRVPFSRDDDFFQVGGHSLSAMRLAARIANVFGVPAPLRDLFEQRTIAAIAANVRGRLGRPGCDAEATAEDLDAAPGPATSWTLDADTVEDLDVLVQDTGIHRAMALLAAYAAFVARSERPGVNVAGRVIEPDAHDDPSFLDFTERVRAALLAPGPLASAGAHFVSSSADDEPVIPAPVGLAVHRTAAGLRLIHAGAGDFARFLERALRTPGARLSELP